VGAHRRRPTGASLTEPSPAAAALRPGRRAAVRREIGLATRSAFAPLVTSILALQAARFVSDIVLAASAPPREYGVWKLVQVYLAFAPLILLGLPSGMNRRLPAARAARDPERAAAISATGFSASVIGLCVVGGFAAALVPDSPDALVAAVFVAWAAWGVALGILNGLELFRRIALIQFVVGGLLIVFLPLTIWRGIDGFLLSYAIIGSVGAVAAFLVAHAATGSRIRPRMLPALVRAGFPLALLALAYIFTTALDRIVVQWQIGLHEVGLYGLAATIFAVVSTIPTTAVQYWYPRTLRAFAETRDVVSAALEARRHSRLLLLVTAAVVLAVAIVLVPVVNVILPEYEQALPAAYVLLPGVLVLPAVGVYGNLLIALEQTRPYLVTQAACVVLEVGLLVGAASTGSITLVAAAVSFSFCVYYALVRTTALRVAHRMAAA
jgi:O-antigen/teichoic acid export membrane protein